MYVEELGQGYRRNHHSKRSQPYTAVGVCQGKSSHPIQQIHPQQKQEHLHMYFFFACVKLTKVYFFIVSDKIHTCAHTKKKLI